jgi:hypothetical protein
MLNQKNHIIDIVIQIKCKCYYADPCFAPNSIPKLYTFLYLHFTFVCMYNTYCVSVKVTVFVIAQG